MTEEQDVGLHGSAYGGYRLFVDEDGRNYRIGESPKDITKKLTGVRMGRPVLWVAAWLSFFMGSVLQYGWAIAATPVISYFHMSFIAAYAQYSIYVLFEAALVAYTYGWLRERGYITPRRVMLMSALMLFMAYYWLAHAWTPWILWVGYAAIGGFGSGFGYATGATIVSKWFPDKKGFLTGLANGAWAYGGAPFIFIYALYLNSSTLVWIFIMTGAIIGIGMIFPAIFAIDPPKNWWPKEVDPIKARKGTASRELKHNPPAVAQWSVKEFWATRQGKALVAVFTLGLTASLFNVGYYASFGAAMGFSGLIAFAIGSAGFAAADGLGRPSMGLISTRVGRRNMVAAAYLFMGIGGLGVLYSGLAHLAVLFAILAILTGAVSGACFVFLIIIAGDYFGENNVGKIWGMSYMFKFVGGAIAGLGIAALLTYTSFDWTIAFWLGTLFAIGGAVIALAFLRPPTIEQYVAVRRKLGLEIPEHLKVKTSASSISRKGD